METRNALLLKVKPRPDPLMERPPQDELFAALERLFFLHPSQKPKNWNMTVRG